MFQPVNKPLFALAAYSKNDKLIHHSSSGAIFYQLAEYVIEQAGVVYATSFMDDFSVHFSRADDLDGVFRQVGSKYVQSYFFNIYDSLIDDLEQGRYVLFVGTPCQVAAMRALCPKSEKLLLVDIICHGTPSPRVWKDYLSFFKNKYKITTIESINFRNKSKGWDNSYASCLIGGKEYSIQPYMEMYGERTTIRPSCYNCKFCSIERVSDITLGDFWGIKNFDRAWYVPQVGTSLVLCNTQKGNEVIEHINSYTEFKKYDINSIPLQMNLKKPTERPTRRDKYWEDYTNKGFSYVVGLYGGDHGFGMLKKKIHKIMREVKLR